jgi:hypothetical protein
VFQIRHLLGKDSDTDPQHWITNPVPTLYFKTFEDAKKQVFFKTFVAYYLPVPEVHLHHFETVQYTGISSFLTSCINGGGGGAGAIFIALP